jgi:hypothetical protein
MTPRTWAAKLVERTPVKDGETDAQFMERLVLKQHARAVRIVKQYYKRYGTGGSPCELICNDILAALQRGRTGRGK